MEPDLAKLFARRSLPTARHGYDKEATDALLDELKRCLEKLLAERNAAEARAAELAEQLATVETDEPPMTAAEASDQEADEPEAESGHEPEPPMVAAEPPEQRGEPEPENAGADEIDQSAAATQAAVLDEFAEANQELERLAEEARARVRALAERLASGADPEE